MKNYVIPPSTPAFGCLSVFRSWKSFSGDFLLGCFYLWNTGLEIEFSKSVMKTRVTPFLYFISDYFWVVFTSFFFVLMEQYVKMLNKKISISRQGSKHMFADQNTQPGLLVCHLLQESINLEILTYLVFLPLWLEPCTKQNCKRLQDQTPKIA